MSPDILIIFGLLVAAIFLFSYEKIPFDITALILLSILLITGILTPEEGLSGFSNTATITIAAMFILSEGIRKTGALNDVSDFFARLGKKSPKLGIIFIMAVIGIISGFINNTAAVAIFIPVMITLSRDIEVGASKLLMPLSFASMFGGVCTLIGTSTNILVSSIAQEEGLQAFSMFEFAPMGIIFFIAGFIYMFTVGSKLIPDRREKGELTQDYQMQEYLTDVIIEPDSEWVGQPMNEAPILKDLDLDLLRVFKSSGGSDYKQTTTRLEGGDVLRIRGSVNEIDKLIGREDVSLKPTKHWYDVDLQQGSDALVEAILAPNSSLAQKTIGEIDFLERFGAVVLAIRHHGELEQEDLSNIKLEGGDSLLLSISRDRIREVQDDASFVVASEAGVERYRSNKMPIAIGILGMVVGLAAFGFLPIVVTAVMGVILMNLTGCLSTEEAYKAVNWKVIVLLGGIIPFGIAMQKTGAAELLSQTLIGFLGGMGPTAIVSGFFFLSMMLTNLISNQATAVLLAPIAIDTASSIGMSVEPLLMAVTFAASLSFMTPVGYQTNTMVYGAGQYKFTDFTKVGTPLNIIFWILGTIFIPIFWPF
ncbi:MAG: SLC13 family permease [Candidatus Halalkalibacterium sp. M3_1C_030]